MNTCKHCKKTIPQGDNITPLFCPHCKTPIQAQKAPNLYPTTGNYQIQQKSHHTSQNNPNPPKFPNKTQARKRPIKQAPTNLTIPDCYQGRYPVKKSLPSAPKTFPLAIRDLTEQSKNQPYALLELAQRYLYGQGCNANPRTAWELLQNDSLTNYPRRYFLLGQFHHHYSYEQNSISHAIQYYTLASELGCALSAVELAIYDMDHNDPPTQGDLVFRQLLQSKDPKPISYYLGHCFLQGYGTPVNLEKAHHWLQFSYQCNDPKGYVGLARYCLKTGNGLQAHQILDEGVEQSMRESTVYLANCYLFAMAVPESPLFALELLEKCDGLSLLLNRRTTPKEQESLRTELTTYAKYQSAEEILQLKKVLFPHLKLYHLATAYEKEKNYPALKATLQPYLAPSPQQNTDTTLHPATVPSFYECMGENPPPQIYHLLGKLYEYGEVLPHSQEKALYFYHKAVSYHYGKAIHTLGRYHEEGSYFRQNLDQALHHYKTASDQGEAPSTYRLGQCLHEGIGIPQDKALALRYFQLAKEQGYPVPTDFLEQAPEKVAP